jgi:hypothetical protein
VNLLFKAALSLLISVEKVIEELDESEAADTDTNGEKNQQNS